jgi:hypothetical protein
MKKQTLGLITIVILVLGIIFGSFVLRNSNFSLKPKAKERTRCVGTGYSIGPDLSCYLIGGGVCDLHGEKVCCNKKVDDKYCNRVITQIISSPTKYELKNGKLKLKEGCKGSGYNVAKIDGDKERCFLIGGAVCGNNQEYCCNKEVDMSYCKNTKKQ